MNCPKCKNPIEDNATVCEWCGKKLSNNPNDIYDVLSISKDSLDGKIIEKLRVNTIPLTKVLAGYGHPVVRFYKEHTGKNIYQCRHDVMRLNYYVMKEKRNESCSKDDWQKEWNGILKLLRKRANFLWWGCLLIITIPSFAAGALSYEYIISQYKKNGLWNETPTTKSNF